MMSYPEPSKRFLAASHVDFAPTLDSPSSVRLVLAALISAALSLFANALLIRVGTRLFPATTGYSHFRFSDYATLTCIGIVFACPAWFVTVRISSTPRWLFFRLAVLVTIALWLPDVWLLLKHEPFSAVGVLMMMHLAVALITYNVLVHEAPPRPKRLGLLAEPPGQTLQHRPAEVGRFAWIGMISAVSLEFVTGVATMLFVPYSRPNGWLPKGGQVLYLCHAVLGGVIAIGAVALLLVGFSVRRGTRVGAIVGFIGIAIAALGGSLSTDHRVRTLAMGLMFIGATVSCFGYAAALIETGQDRWLDSFSEQDR